MRSASKASGEGSHGLGEHRLVPVDDEVTQDMHRAEARCYVIAIPTLLTSVVPCSSIDAAKLNSSTLLGSATFIVATRLPIEHQRVGFCCQLIAAISSSGFLSRIIWIISRSWLKTLVRIPSASGVSPARLCGSPKAGPTWLRSADAT